VTPDSITVGELQGLLAAGRRVTVVDVRSPAEIDWAIPGSIQVDAYADLQSGRLGHLSELNLAQGPVVTVCGIGRTAAVATDMLRARGIEALTLDGGMRAWSMAWNVAEATVSGVEVIQVRRTGKGCLSYILGSGSEALVIDAALDPDVYVGLVRERGWRLVAAVDTHIHADHLSRSRLLARQAGVELWLPAQGRSRHPFRPVAEGDQVSFGSAELVALHTPGHTAESTAYLLDNAGAFTGDTLFIGGIGRPDLEGGTDAELEARARLLHASISRLLGLPEAVLVLPGHAAAPIPFDGRLVATTVETIRDTVSLARLEADEFVQAVLGRIPPNPPNHSLIVDFNERGELPDDPSELEAGANRCAIS